MRLSLIYEAIWPAEAFQKALEKDPKKIERAIWTHGDPKAISRSIAKQIKRSIDEPAGDPHE